MMLALLTGLMETLLTLLLEECLQYFIVRLNVSYLIDRVTLISLTTMPPFNKENASWSENLQLLKIVCVIHSVH